MWVVKLGGSLFDSDALPRWLDVLAEHGRGKVVIVPGGGPFADQVRAAQARWRFDDAAAHAMALRGMDQYGLMMTGLKPGLIPAGSLIALRRTLDARRVPVWMAAEMVTASDLKPSWSLTSDSLAAWLAIRLGARQLMLVKSATLKTAETDAATLAREGVVDKSFASMIEGADFSTWIGQREGYRSFQHALNGGGPAGVRILQRKMASTS